MTSKGRRINAILSEDLVGTLKAMAREQDTTITNILKQSIGLCEWFHQAKKDGARVLIERGDKQFEVSFF